VKQLQPLVGEFERQERVLERTLLPYPNRNGNGGMVWKRKPLIKGTKEGVENWGKEGGFLDNPAVGNSISEEYEKVANTLRRVLV